MPEECFWNRRMLGHVQTLSKHHPSGAPLESQAGEAEGTVLHGDGDNAPLRPQHHGKTVHLSSLWDSSGGTDISLRACSLKYPSCIFARPMRLQLWCFRKRPNDFSNKIQKHGCPARVACLGVARALHYRGGDGTWLRCGCRGLPGRPYQGVP